MPHPGSRCLPRCSGQSESLAGEVGARSVAYDPVDAIRIADEFNPHVVILDIVLPLKDGFKLGTELMERHPKCKVAALTGMGSAEYVELSKKNGFKYHLLKPMNPEQLAQIIEHDPCSETKDCEECVS
jgi:DNA-binding response OmpR family regulator